MEEMNVVAGSTDVTTYVDLRLAADDAAATGLTITDIDLQYCRSGATPAAKADATALAATNTAHTDNYAIEIDATDQPGIYRVDWPDAAFAAGVRGVILSVKCATAKTAHIRANLTPVTANVQTMATDTVTAAALASDAASEIANAGYSLFSAGNRIGIMAHLTLQPFAFEQITDLSSAVGLNAANAALARAVRIYAGTKSIRVRLDGTAPTASVGEVIAAGSYIEYGNALGSLQMIETEASAEADIHYFR